MQRVAAQGADAARGEQRQVPRVQVRSGDQVDEDESRRARPLCVARSVQTGLWSENGTVRPSTRHEPSAHAPARIRSQDANTDG